jgi:hypothetical protein
MHFRKCPNHSKHVCEIFAFPGARQREPGMTEPNMKDVASNDAGQDSRWRDIAIKNETVHFRKCPEYAKHS